MSRSPIFACLCLSVCTFYPFPQAHLYKLGIQQWHANQKKGSYGGWKLSFSQVDWKRLRVEKLFNASKAVSIKEWVKLNKSAYELHPSQPYLGLLIQKIAKWASPLLEISNVKNLWEFQAVLYQNAKLFPLFQNCLLIKIAWKPRTVYWIVNKERVLICF